MELTQWNQEPSGRGAHASHGQLTPWSPPAPAHTTPSPPPRLEAGPVQAPLGGLVTGHSEALLLSRVAGSVCSWASTPGAELGHLSHDLKPKPFWKKCSFPGVPVSIV